MQQQPNTPSPPTEFSFSYDLLKKFPDPKNSIPYLTNIIKDVMRYIEDERGFFRLQLFQVLKELLVYPQYMSSTSYVTLWLGTDMNKDSTKSGTNCNFQFAGGRLYACIYREECQLVTVGEYVIYFFAVLTVMIASTLCIPPGTVCFHFDHHYILDSDRDLIYQRTLVKNRASFTLRINRLLPPSFPTLPGYKCPLNNDFLIFQYLNHLATFSLKDFMVSDYKKFNTCNISPDFVVTDFAKTQAT